MNYLQVGPRSDMITWCQSCVCVSCSRGGDSVVVVSMITAVPNTKLCTWGGIVGAKLDKGVCVCLLLQYLLQGCARGPGGGETMEDMCYERLRAEACVD